MQAAPTFEAIFAVMTAASSGNPNVRVEIPDDADLDDLPTRFGVALNVLLDDLAFRVQEREKVEDKLRHSQKMEAIGELAGGIAHDFNNILSVILGYSDLLLSGLKPTDSMFSDLSEIKRSGERARDLTRQLLAFSRKQVLRPQVLQLDSVLHGLDKMLRRLIGEGVELSLITHKKSGTINADKGQLEQVVLNLVVNARDAMPDGGRLSIEVEDVEIDEGYAAHHPEVIPGPYVMLAVSDTGTGMTPEVRSRIFEPFFTTKALGKGTGLGLATVFGIVRQSGGHLWVYSEADHGTTFKVYFPRSHGASEQETERPVANRDLSGVETVLVAEDDLQVRALTGSVLRRNGYNVIEAETAGDAILVSEEYPAKIHLLLTDVVMPRMSGRLLAERVTQHRPESKVLFMSGYTDDAIVHHGVLDAGTAFLEKPFTPDALLRRVREILDED